MIKKFTVKNFRSFQNEVTLNLVKSAKKGFEHHTVELPGGTELLKSVVIYGANASGKSNLLLAARAVEFLVLNSADFKPDTDIPPYEPYKLSKQHIQEPIEINLEFFEGGIQYKYSLSFTGKEVYYEELIFYPHDRPAVLFKRVKDREIIFGDSYKGSRKPLERMLLPNQLFLSKAAQNNVQSVLPAYRFFSGGLMIHPFFDQLRESSLSRLYARRLAEKPQSAFAERFNNLICALDTGIQKVEIKETDWSEDVFSGALTDTQKQKLKEESKYDIKTRHAFYDKGKLAGETYFDYHEESRGTQSLFVMAGIILDALEQGRTLIVDEFEKNLHPDITKYLVNLFHDERMNPLNAQLIFATHDVTQLSDDRFRRDQVWFVEKDEFGASSLFSAAQIKGFRADAPMDKWYSSGRLGATPIIDDVDFQIAMEP